MHAAPLAGVPLLHVHVAGLQTRFDSSVPGDFVSPLAPVPVPPPLVVPPGVPPVVPPLLEPEPPLPVVVPPPLVPVPAPLPLPAGLGARLGAGLGVGGGSGSQHVASSSTVHVVHSQKVCCASSIRFLDGHQVLI